MASLTDILNFDRSELVADLQKRLELESFRARQLISWLYRKRETDFFLMSDISKEVRNKLRDTYRIYRPSIIESRKSVDGSIKYLFELDDRSLIETVLVKQPSRLTLCISSQVGCAVGCSFCQTGSLGLKRNLETYEIVSQVLIAQEQLASIDSDARIDNIVFMGMGEPMHNVQNVIRAVRLLTDDLGFSFSIRKVTVSTSGFVPGIQKFAEANTRVNLAVSLNATDDETRNKLIPLNKSYSLSILLSALRRYPLKNGRRITIEYVLLKGVNDTEEDLKRLPILLKHIPVKINLIPCTGANVLGYEAPDDAWILHWQETLLKAGLNSSVRWSKGSDIGAACGQLVAGKKRQ